MIALTKSVVFLGLAIWLELCSPLASGNSTCLGQSAPIRAVGRELIEAIAVGASKSAGRSAAKEIAELGGERVLQELGERVLREGGEEALDLLVAYVGRFGPGTIRALDHCSSPSKLLRLLSEVPAEDLPKILGRLAAGTEGRLLSEGAVKYGKQVLLAEARNPGLGGTLVSQLGSESAELALNATRGQLATILRVLPELKSLPPSHRSTIIQLLTAQTDRLTTFIGNFLNANPGKSLFAGTTLVAVLSQSERILGGCEVVMDEEGKPINLPKEGLVDRVTDSTLGTMFSGINIAIKIFAVAAAVIASIGSILYLRHRLRPSGSGQHSTVTPFKLDDKRDIHES